MTNNIKKFPKKKKKISDLYSLLPSYKLQKVYEPQIIDHRVKEINGYHVGIWHRFFEKFYGQPSEIDSFLCIAKDGIPIGKNNQFQIVGEATFRNTENSKIEFLNIDSDNLKKYVDGVVTLSPSLKDWKYFFKLPSKNIIIVGSKDIHTKMYISLANPDSSNQNSIIEETKKFIKILLKEMKNQHHILLTKQSTKGLNMDDNQQNIIIYNTKDGKASVSLYAKDGMVWMNQNQIAQLFDTSVPNISMHISNILKEKELSKKSVVKDYLTTATDGKEYNVAFYSLDMILSIGFRVRSKRGTQFRIWANQNLKEYMIKGFVMDDDRLKNPDGRPDYFDELLERIREIRASEKRFYQKVRDLFALSSDYDKTDKATQMFFAETQNKLLFAVTGQTAAEIVLDRSDADKPNMALTSWKGSVVRKQDIFIAKNYLNTDEIDTLNRLVVIFLETAELRAKNRIDITMKFWQENVDRILEFNEQPLLTGKGKVRNAAMKEKVRQIYQLFDTKRKAYEAIQADQQDLEELKQLEQKIKKDK